MLKRALITATLAELNSTPTTFCRIYSARADWLEPAHTQVGRPRHLVPVPPVGRQLLTHTTDVTLRAIRQASTQAGQSGTCWSVGRPDFEHTHQPVYTTTNSGADWLGATVTVVEDRCVGGRFTATTQPLGSGDGEHPLRGRRPT